MSLNNGEAIEAAENYLKQADKTSLTTVDGDKVLCVPSSCLERLVSMSKNYLRIAKTVRELSD